MRIVQGLFTSAAVLALWPQVALAEAAESAEAGRGDIVVTGTLEQPNASATGLALTLRETPQSVTVIDRARIEDFALTNVNDLLTNMVGINVARNETDRTEYDARGFDITNFQVDGIGLGLRWGIQFGDMDTVLYENVEAVRGANAIMTGIGNPSATINYVRKRPTQSFQANVSGSLGSWDQKRVEADVSVPLNADGTVAVRLIYAHDDKDSYLRFNHVNRNVYGAIAAWQITPQLTATVGYTRQDNDSDGVLWGALPLLYADGTRIPYQRSSSTSPDWTFWNISDQTAFAELAYAIEGWEAKGRVTYNRRRSLAQLFYAYGYPDKATGLGIGGMTGRYRSPSHQYLGDLYVSGPVALFGREHKLAIGVSTANMKSLEYQAFSSDFPDYPPVSQWAAEGFSYPKPVYPAEDLSENTRDKLTRVYGAFHVNLSDKLKAVVGASAMWLKTTGESYTVDQYRKDNKISPYVGAVFDVTSNVSLYASYTDIFNPQKEVDFSNRRLAPAKGTSVEGGIKSEWFDKRLYVSAAVFRARQDGLAASAGVFEPGDNGPVGKEYSTGVDTTSKGFEIELTGSVTDRWKISGGYTGLRIRDQDGHRTRTFTPTKSLKLATTYTVPEWRDLKVGAQFRWQNAVSYLDADIVDEGIVTDPVTIRQKSYAVLDLMAAIRVIDHLTASVNIRNVTDTKYLNSLKWGQAYYAAPRSALVTLSFDY